MLYWHSIIFKMILSRVIYSTSEIGSLWQMGDNKNFLLIVCILCLNQFINIKGSHRILTMQQYMILGHVYYYIHIALISSSEKSEIVLVVHCSSKFSCLWPLGEGLELLVPVFLYLKSLPQRVVKTINKTI